MRKDILNIVKQTIEDSGIFKKVYFGVAPPVTTPRSYPSIAIVPEYENRNRVNVTGCTFESELNISLIIYHKSKQNKFEDIISDIIEQVEMLFVNNPYLDGLVLDYWVYKIEQDGGVLHPNYIANVGLKIIYRK